MYRLFYFLKYYIVDRIESNIFWYLISVEGDKGYKKNMKKIYSGLRVRYIN